MDAGSEGSRSSPSYSFGLTGTISKIKTKLTNNERKKNSISTYAMLVPQLSMV